MKHFKLSIAVLVFLFTNLLMGESNYLYYPEKFNGVSRANFINGTGAPLLVKVPVGLLPVIDITAAPEDILLSATSIDENMPISSTVGTFSTVDPDSDTFVYTLVEGDGAADNDFFYIEGNALTALPLNYEQQSSYSIRVKTADPEGNTFEKIFTITVNDISETTTPHHLYYANLFLGLFKANLDGSAPESVYIKNMAGVFDFEVDYDGQKLYWAEADVNDGPSTIKKANLDGSGVETIVADAAPSSGLGLDLNTRKIYFSGDNNTTIKRADLDGSNVETIITDNTAKFAISITVSATLGKIFYFSNPDNAATTVYSANLDGSEIQSLLTRNSNNDGWGVSVDEKNEKLFYTQASTDEIYKMNLDGTDSELILDEANGVNGIANIAVDTSTDAIYWANLFGENQNNNIIRKANSIDGSGVTDVVNTGFMFTTNIVVLNIATETTLSQNTINENRPTETVVGNFLTKGIHGDDFIYTLVDGEGSDNNDLFTIDGKTLKSLAKFNYEVKQSYTIRVRTAGQQSNTVENIFVININDNLDEGHNSLIKITDEPVGDNCKNGGKKIESGIDLNDNGTLEEIEVTSTEFVCNGTDGTDGVDGTDGTNGTDGADGNNGTNGTDGADGNNGTNGADGKDGTNGTNGTDGTDGTNGTNGTDGKDGSNGNDSIIKITEEPAGKNCEFGGKKVEIGTDKNGNTVLDSEEIAETEYLCNTKNSGTTSSNLVDINDEPAGKNCEFGGQRIDNGIDKDSNSKLDEDEISATKYVCNGGISNIQGGSSDSGCSIVAVESGNLNFSAIMTAIILLFAGLFFIRQQN